MERFLESIQKVHRKRLSIKGWSYALRLLLNGLWLRNEMRHSVYRRSIGFSWKRQRTVLARRGLRYQRADGTIGNVKANAVDMDYDMWVWSNNLDKINLCVEKYIQWQHQTPKVSIVFDTDFVLNPNLQFSPVVDDSAIEDVFNTGKIWAFRMPLHIDGWLPETGTTVGQVYKIQLTLYDADEVADYSEIIVPGASQNTELEAALRMFRAKLFGIVEVSPTTKTFTVSDDRTDDFSVGSTFMVENSTDNDEMYTVVSTVYSIEEDQTVIEVAESLVSSVADGNIYKPEVL